MSQGDEDTEKEHEPTQKKLDDARRKGDIPKSVDLTTAAAYGGLLVSLFALGGDALSQAGQAMASLLDRADLYAEIWFANHAQPLAGQLIVEITTSFGGLFLIPAMAALVAIIAQRAFVVAPDKLQPKLSRISPISNAKNKFGRSGLFEFAKSFVKLLIYSGFLGLFLYWQLDEILAVVHFNPQAALLILFQMVVEFFAIVLVVAACIGAVDLLFQQQEHMRKNRMSRKEIMDETKQAEGDPHMKQQRRQRAQEIAMNKMLADVPEADVVIVNPSHYAVALKWSRQAGAAPECVAKGVDEIAARIRELASEAGVPIHRDPPTARALFATVEIGQEIRPEHYRAVAAAIRFAEAMRAKAKRNMV